MSAKTVNDAIALRAITHFFAVADWEWATVYDGTSYRPVHSTIVRDANRVGGLYSSPNATLDRFVNSGCFEYERPEQIERLSRCEFLPTDTARFESFKDLFAEVKSNGAVLLRWHGHRDVFDGYLREWVFAFASNCGLEISRERWRYSTIGELWLVAASELRWLESVEDAEKLIASLIMLHGGARCSVTLSAEVDPNAKANTWDPPKARPTRDESFGRWRRASVRIEFKDDDSDARVQPMRLPKLVRQMP